MSITGGEHPRQKAKVDARQPTTSREYWCSGTYDRSAALVWVASYSPAFDSCIDGSGLPITLFRKNVNIRETGGGTWDFTVDYESSTSTVELNFSFGVQNVKVYQALETVRMYDCVDGGSGAGPADFGNNVPNFHGAIGVNGNEVQGVDIEAGNVTFSITKKWDRGSIPGAYFTLLAILTDRTPCNDDIWSFAWMGQVLTFAKGTLRFRGAPLKWTSYSEVEITYNFAFSRTIEAIATWDVATTYAVGDRVIYNGREWISNQAGAGVTPGFDAGNTWSDLGDDANLYIGNSDAIEKEGHHYLWVNYKQVVSNSTEVPTPVAAVVSRVLPYVNFNTLAI